MTTAIETLTFPRRSAARDQRPVRAWLYTIALLILAMVVVGGATRLTHSGLSITEWQPVHGVIPPLNDAQWQDEFAKYQQIPEYQQLNRGMSLGEFKGIFWWEWAHRMLARAIGVVFLLPLLWFWATGRIGRDLVPKLVGIFVLGGIQGAIGWWMVASGLVNRTDVSQYRLAIHLTFACVILAYVIAVARSLGPALRPARNAIRRFAAAIVGLAFVQIFLGGIVAGLDAGLAYNTWPTMNGALVPQGLFSLEPAWRNVFENPLTAQFDHRLVAYVLFAAAWAHALQARRSAVAGTAWLLAGLVTLQACLGIATLLAVVPLPLALLHQFGAVTVLSAAVYHWRSMTEQARLRLAPAG